MILLLGVYYPAVGQNQLPVMVMERMQLNLRGLVEKMQQHSYSTECKAVHTP